MGDEKSAQPEHKPSENYAAERIRELVRRRPILSISIIAALSLLIGVAIGVSDEGRAGELEDEVAELERALADAEEAGLYRAPGGGACYWELLTEPAGAGVDHIIDNGGGKNQTLRIDSPFFSTDGCGEWVKIE